MVDYDKRDSYNQNTEKMKKQLQMTFIDPTDKTL